MRVYNDGTPNVSYSYDAAHVAFAKGRLTAVSSSVSSYSYGEYDPLGRVKTATQTTDGQAYTMSYAYNKAGALVSQTYPSGRVVSNYDGAGRIAGVKKSMKNEEYYIRGKIVAICEATLAEEIGIIAASRRLSALGLKLFGSRDENFIMFDVVDSETDHLPVDTGRKNWEAEALKRKDAEIAKAEALYKDDVIAACRKLIERFAIYNKFES